MHTFLIGLLEDFPLWREGGWGGIPLRWKNPENQSVYIRKSSLSIKMFYRRDFSNILGLIYSLYNWKSSSEYEKYFEMHPIMPMHLGVLGNLP